MIEHQLEEIVERLTDIAHHLARLVDGGSGAVPGSTPAAEAAPKTRASRAHTIVGHVSAQSEPAEPAPMPAAEPQAPAASAAQPAAAPAATLDDVRAAFAKLAAAKGRDLCVAVLSRFGVAKVTAVAPDQYGKLVADCERVAAGGEP